ncbi:tyrosine-type recombinase/integrase [Arthrobacter pigmenti]
MSLSALETARIQPVASAPAWPEWLESKLAKSWRQKEWDRRTLLFSADPANPLTSVHTCIVKACRSHTSTPRAKCQSCRKAASKRGHPEGFDSTYQPDTIRRRPNYRSDGNYPGLSQFSLADLKPGIRTEILFGIQQRDAAGFSLVPPRYRRFTALLPAGLETVLDLRDEDFSEMTPAVAGVARSVVGHVRRARLEYDGEDATEGDVWDASLVGLAAGRGTSRSYVAVSGIVDFRNIRQQWLRTTVKAYARAIRPCVLELRQIVVAVEIASSALDGRANGDCPRRLGMSDMSTIVDLFRTIPKPSGQPYSTAHRRALLRHWRTFIEFARQGELIDDVPGGFAINPKFHSIQDEAVDLAEDELGKSIPPHIIAQLDSHLHLLGTASSFSSGGWTNLDYARMYQTMYVLLRDTGRRPGEIAGLMRDCLEYVDGKPTLIYNNYKRRRYRRRLPIAESTAENIASWQSYLKALPPVVASKEWLFPAPGAQGRPRTGHVSAAKFGSSVFRTWVDVQVEQLTDELLDDAGDPARFDRSSIIPYGFRHSYAQRHADAGTAPDVLRELMDHRSLDTTMGYYKVSLERKQAAINVVASHTMDRNGQPRAYSDPVAYEVETVAVPFGGCTEPSNVKAGGNHCRIRFQCAGCDFYRPDPSYLPAMEQQIADLRADKEVAIAMGAADWVIRNFDDQIGAYSRTRQAMQSTLTALPETEQTAVEDASRELRKIRSAKAFIPLDGLKVRPAQ